ncbi:MAG: hypothetical protein AB1480_16855 [Nitrospirota bacterium]
MNERILIVGNLDTCKALMRVILNIDYMKRTLIRVLYSRNFTDRILISDRGQVTENLKTYDIRLIIMDIDNTDHTIIQRIRFGEFGDTIARIPIIVFSIFPVTKCVPILILHHIKTQGAFLEIPFRLERLHEILETARFLDKSQLEHVRSDRNIFCELIESKIHSLTEKDYEENVLNIIRIAKFNFPGKYLNALVKIQNALEDVKKGIKSIWDLKNALSRFKEEIINERCE